MYISKLHLKNFRNVAEATFRFRRNFTVVIGVNGKGKSTILQGLRIASGAFLLGIPEVKSRHIQDEEIRLKQETTYLASQTPVLVEATGMVSDENEITWRRRIPTGKRKTTSSAEDVGQIRELGLRKYEQMLAGGENGDHLDLPVIAFFGTSRVHGAARKRGSRIGRQIFKEGYHDWFEMKSSTFGFEEFLGSFEVLSEENREHSEGKEVLLNTILKANPQYLKRVAWANDELWLHVEMEGETSSTMPLSLHSDGVRTYTEMVAELAYRCIVLNGYKGANAVSDTKGVVLIDELDIHLHPSWQKHVVDDLQAAFPKIQFIATTHSPFIVQSLSEDELINLDYEGSVNPSSLSLEDVAEEIMGVESAFSIESETLESLSKNYLEVLDKSEKANRGIDETAVETLDEIESQISDPVSYTHLTLPTICSV